MTVSLLNPKPGETIIDPACGSGGFLVAALEHVWLQVESQGEKNGWTESLLERRKRETAQHCIRGIDKDSFLTQIAKAYMALIGDGRGHIFCEDTLSETSDWSPSCQSSVQMGLFDIVVTNPPFGSKVKVTGRSKLAQYHLGKKWKKPSQTVEDWEMQSEVRPKQAPQILFIERCIQLLKPGGRMGIVLPESLFGMASYGYVVKYLYDNYRLHAFISLPDEVFQPYTHAKTCVLILENSPPTDNDSIEMAIADWCGHDSRGNPTIRVDEDGTAHLLDDLPLIAAALSGHLPWSSNA